MCLVRPLFVGLMTTLAILCTAEGLVVGACCWSRHCSSSAAISGIEVSPYHHSHHSSDKLHRRLVSAVLRRSSFFATAFGGSGHSFSNSSTVAASASTHNPVTARRKKKRRRREETRSGDSTTTTIGSSGDDQQHALTHSQSKNARRPMLPMSTPMTLTSPKVDRPPLQVIADFHRPDPPKTLPPARPPLDGPSKPRFTMATNAVHPVTSVHQSPGEWMLSQCPEDGHFPEPAPAQKSVGDRNRVGAGSLSGASTIDCPVAKVLGTGAKEETGGQRGGLQARRRPLTDTGICTSDFF